jgi:hypothetical protein
LSTSRQCLVGLLRQGPIRWVSHTIFILILFQGSLWVRATSCSCRSEGNSADPWHQSWRSSKFVQKKLSANESAISPRICIRMTKGR